MKRLESVFEFGAAWWRKLGMEIVRRTKTLTKRGVGCEGKFAGYTGEYAKRKADGGFKRQSSTSTSPDLQLTGDMLRDLKVKGDVNAQGVTVGWTVWGQRMLHNAEQGRAISTEEHPLAPAIEAYAMEKYNEEVAQLLRKTAKTDTIPLNIM